MIKLIIFDMDGVIADSMKVHSVTLNEILKRYGFAGISQKEYSDKYAGLKSFDYLSLYFRGKLNDKKLTQEEFDNIDINKIVEEKQKRVIELIKNEVYPIDGFFDFFNTIKSKYTLAVGSGAKKEFINYVLKKLNIIDDFKFISSSYEVDRGKPHPDVFLAASKNLGFKPEECLVIEDGVSGMVAAKSAGMKSIGFRSELNNLLDVSLKEKFPADILVNDLRQITVEMIESL